MDGCWAEKAGYSDRLSDLFGHYRDRRGDEESYHLGTNQVADSTLVAGFRSSGFGSTER